MHTIQIEISDQLPKLLEAGLRVWQQRKLANREETEAEKVRRVLAASGRVRVPRPYAGSKPYVRHTPVPITGQQVSEIVIEQRGPR